MQENENRAAEEELGAGTGKERMYTQAEFDAAVEAERGKYETKLAEAEKLSAMSTEKRAEYLRGQLEKSLAEREAAVARRELMAEAVEKLDAAGLPKQLAECLDYSGREERDESLVRVGKAFEDALTAAVTQRLRGRTPKLASGGSSDAFLEGLGVYGNK